MFFASLPHRRFLANVSLAALLGPACVAAAADIAPAAMPDTTQPATSVTAPAGAATTPPGGPGAAPAASGTGPAAAAPVAALPPLPTGLSFSCARKLEPVEQLICDDPALAALDRKLVGVVAAASKRQPSTTNLQTLSLVQQQWRQDRDSCATAADARRCVSGVYRARIAELQGQYRLVPAHGPFRFACTGADNGPLVISYYDTDPPSASMETDKGTDLLFIAESGSGARYAGGGVQFWEHQGTATVTWQQPAAEATCRRVS